MTDQMWQIVDDFDNVYAQYLTQDEASALLTRYSNEGMDLYMQEKS